MARFCFHRYDSRVADLVMPPSYHVEQVGRKKIERAILEPVEMVYDVCSKCGKEKFLYKRGTTLDEIEVHYGNL